MSVNYDKIDLESGLEQLETVKDELDDNGYDYTEEKHRLIIERTEDIGTGYVNDLEYVYRTDIPMNEHIRTTFVITHPDAVESNLF